MGVFKRASEKVDQIIREEVDEPRRLAAGAPAMTREQIEKAWSKSEVSE
jgi:hypothetical protein